MADLTEILTIRDLIRWATSRFKENSLFFGHGTESAWDDAVTLILHGLSLSHDLYPQILDCRLTKQEKEKLLISLQKRYVDRIPVPYITHEAWFAGATYYVDERVLIPRSPFAELISNDFQPWLTFQPEKILDLCTGSSCIAVATALQFPNAEVDASDISPDALIVAKINVSRHEVDNQVNLYKSDLFADLPQKKYDLIISNPPYVDAVDMANLPKEYKHEPQLGLAAGDQGLDFALKILQTAPDYLSDHGVLMVEVGNSETALINMFPDAPFTWIEFQNGGGGVFLISCVDLKKYPFQK